MKLILIRHGETQWNKEMKVQGGLSDIPLNDTGQKQAKLTGERLKKEKIDLFFSSPMKRAIQTAQIINEHHNKEILIEDSLLERSFGKLEGTHYPDLNYHMQNIYLDDSYEEFDIERIEIFKERLKKFWENLLNTQFGKTIVIVSHSSTSKMLLSIIHNLHIEEIRKKIIKKNASISIIEFDENKKIKNAIHGDDTHLKE